MSKKKIGLVPKLIMGIIAGILIGSFAPEFLVKVLVTASSLFSAFLKFVIPFIIIGFVTAGIADLATGAGKLLGVTTGIAYGSTIVGGLLALTVASTVFPSFLTFSLNLSSILILSYLSSPVERLLTVCFKPKEN